MTVTHPHLLEKAIRSETTHCQRCLFVIASDGWDLAFAENRYWKAVQRIRADYKRRVQKKGRRAA